MEQFWRILKMLYYIPLEIYEERYTKQWSAPVTGWLERNWIANNIPYVRVDSLYGPDPSCGIESGAVLDVTRRAQHGFAQTARLIDFAVEGKLTSDDVIFFDDFWHPGFEMLPYTFHQLGIKPKMYAFCHAQSVDEFDFTYDMRRWMRVFEQGIGRVLDGIFVNSTLLKDLLVQASIQSWHKIHVIGHIFCEEEVLERMPKKPPLGREIDVIFTSRWDDEKNPIFFLEVMERVIQLRPHLNIEVCTGAQSIRSNNKRNIEALEDFITRYPRNINIKAGLTKEQYYGELCKSKIQMSTSSQDWVSFVLLEGSVAGCYPIYPAYRSFIQALNNNSNYLYRHLNALSASTKIIDVLKNYDENITPASLWGYKARNDRAWIHKKHNNSWKRMTNIMLGTKMPVESYV